MSRLNYVELCGSFYEIINFLRLKLYKSAIPIFKICLPLFFPSKLVSLLD